MKKIPCLFVRDFTDRRHPKITTQVTPGCEWVMAGEGVATRKWDGTAVMIKDGVLYARYDAKKGKPAPKDGIPCDDPDPITGHHPFWIPATGPEHKWIRKAYESMMFPENGTYEAIGPAINGNHEHYEFHMIAKHDCLHEHCPRDFDGIKQCLSEEEIEGIVFHHSDGRMAKIRRDDFGFEWPIKRDKAGPIRA